ncbi:Gfo/Idh/MocA family oxidoreductase [Campylobacter sp. FMV-PI01]|uniref:Gfo/Idh/MocA family oxidoreductase n=1 Tax=Campylobacter portucalensis TaxID=2608384 RepID=A0A6L5WN26_9BACT|nr:Gfo/Idh/MocA family oxidoreductase [Campylobacter portucalensis]MSN97071.1 Gfo/Idh/MocA family oxidoreductase [Campylobacter portucalensis]
MKKKIVLIGLDTFGKKHLSELRRSDYFELVGVCDLKKCDDFGRFSFFYDIEYMFASTKPQAVIIATPPKTHKEIILKCMKYVKFIFVKTPFAQSVEHARQMRYLSNSNNAKIAVSFNDRFNPVAISLLKELQKEDRIYSINIIRSKKCDDISDLILNDLDLVRVLSKSEINSFDMKKVTYSKNLSVAHCVLKTKNEILVNICSNLFYPDDKAYIEICATNGVYLADLVELSLYKIAKNSRINLRVDRDDFSIRFEHKEFFNICNGLESKSLADIEDVVRIREILK